MEDQETGKESITLTKNAKGDYQWIIKVRDDILNEETLKRLEDKNSELNNKFGKQ